MKVNLYLDIDGVLNAYERKITTLPSLWKDGYRQYGWEWVAPAMIDRLNWIIRHYGVAAYWLTTWEDMAPDFGQTIGLAGSKSWPWLKAMVSGVGSDWPKFTSIREHVAATKPDLAFWFDDDLAYEPSAQRWADEHPNVHAFAPTGTHGITPRMLADMEARIQLWLEDRVTT